MNKPITNKIHYFMYGKTACGRFGDKRPKFWPQGNKWSIYWKDINCEGCLMAREGHTDSKGCSVLWGTIDWGFVTKGTLPVNSTEAIVIANFMYERITHNDIDSFHRVADPVFEEQRKEGNKNTFLDKRLAFAFDDLIMVNSFPYNKKVELGKFSEGMKQWPFFKYHRQAVSATICELLECRLLDRSILRLKDYQ